MDKLELQLIFDGHGIEVPGACASCPRLGALATELCKAESTKTYVVAFSDNEAFTGLMRPYLESFMSEDNPWLSDEEVEARVVEHISAFIGGKKDNGFAEMLMNMGALLQQADESIDPTVVEIKSLLASCAQSGDCKY